MKDPNILTLSEAAPLVGMSEDGLRRRIYRNPDFKAAVVVDMGQSATIRISRPRLMRHLHGEHWREDVAS